MSKGFAYDLDDEKILEYMKLSTEDKLRWLEEINELTQAALSDREKRFLELLRAGEVDLPEE